MRVCVVLHYVLCCIVCCVVFYYVLCVLCCVGYLEVEANHGHLQYVGDLSGHYVRGDVSPL